MINVSQTIKNACNSPQNKHSEYILINGQKVIIKGKLNATAYKDTTFIGTFNLKTLEFETPNDINYRNKELEYYKQINDEYFKIGTFIVTEIKDNDTTESVKVTAMDYGLKFAVPYTTNLDYTSGNVTLYDVLEEACGQVGVELYNEEITNGNFIVENNQFVNNELVGDVISAIAGASCNFATINENDQLELIFEKPSSNYFNRSFKNNITIETFPQKINFQIDGNTQETKTVNGQNLIYKITKSGNTIYLNNETSTTNYIFKKGTYTFSWEDEYSVAPYVRTATTSSKNYSNYVRSDGKKRHATFTITEDFNLSFYRSGITEEELSNVQLIEGSIQKPYLPYGCIGVQNSNSNQNKIYTIDLKGNELIKGDKLYIYKSGNVKLIKTLTQIEIDLDKIEPIETFDGINNISLLTNIETNGEINYYDNNYEVIEDYVELEDKRDTHPITSVSVGTSAVEGQEAILRDEALIDQYGEHWLILNDNPFGYTLEKRFQLVQEIFDKVKGFGYSSFTSKYSYKPYLSLGDTIKFKNKDGNLINSIILRYNMDYENCTFEAPSITSATINYESSPSPYELAKRAEIIANQATSEITSITSNINDLEGRIEQVEVKQTATDLNIEILSTVDEEGNITGVKTATGYTFDKNGLKIYKDNESFNSLHDNTGTYYKDGDTIVSQTTKDGTVTKDFVLYGTYYYGVEDELDVANFQKDDAMFIAQLFTDENGEECVGHFYNR